MTLVMGVLNVTPDSFSDGGQWVDPRHALARGLEMSALGAQIVDVGGESTRPGAMRPTAAEEARRVVPVIRALHQAGVVTSVDTMRSQVAAECLEAGADMVNDVSGGLADPHMAEVVARSGVPFIAMHWRGHSDEMDRHTEYEDVVDDVLTHLRRRVQDLTAQGIAADSIILDPGFGFAKEADHNWALLAAMDQIVALGHRVLVGTSRKRFLAQLPRPAAAEPIPADQRDAATAATSLLAAQAGVWAVRVHDVPSTVHTLGVWDNVRHA